MDKPRAVWWWGSTTRFARRFTLRLALAFFTCTDLRLARRIFFRPRWEACLQATTIHSSSLKASLFVKLSNLSRKCSAFTDLTKDDSELTTDLTNNDKQHHCKSRTRFSNPQHPPRMPRYTKQGNGEDRANIHKHHSPPFFELLVKLKENKDTINLASVVQRVDTAIQRISIGKTKYATRWIVLSTL